MSDEIDILDVALGDVQLMPRAAALAHELRQQGQLRAAPLDEVGRSVVIRQERELQPKDHPEPEEWDASWGNLRSEWIDGGHNPRMLVPRFLRSCGELIRLGSGYASPSSSRALWAAQRVILTHLASKYLSGARALAEFGCGSGFNLLELENQHLEIGEFHGFDYSRAAMMMVRDLGFHAHRFDITNPTMRRERMLISGSAVLTMGALEQVGDQHETFLLYLLHCAPLVCVHVEPLLELYDDSETDQLAAAYHRARGYLSGFLPQLQDLERRGIITICETHRTRLGARHNDGFSWVVWRPTP